jgi:hypothetical protein
MGSRLSRWRFVGASVRGTSHHRSGMPCQDAHEARIVGEGPDGPVLVLACADGAGTAELGEDGARIACARMVELATELVVEGHGVRQLDDGMLPFWIDEAAGTIAIQAEAAERRPRDYACTLLVAVVDDYGAAFAQVGDGAIVVSDGQSYAPVFWPQSGEYANTTFFITDPPARRSVCTEVRIPGPEEVALFTDGLQSLALRFADRSAHAPFFGIFFPALQAQPAGEADSLRVELDVFLSSEPVNQRTDDDKTIVVATRVALAGNGGPLLS